MADQIKLTEDEIESLKQAAMQALPNAALVAAIVDDLIPAIETIKAATWQEAAVAHAQRVAGDGE
jgi:hypothetical protein